MSFQTKTEDLIRLGLNPSHNMLNMLPQPQQNMNGFFMQQNTPQPLLNGLGQDISSLLQGQSMMNPLNQGNVSFNQQQIPSFQQMIGGISAQSIETNSLQQQFLLQQSQSQQQPQQNQNQLQQQQQQQQQIAQFQQVQQQPQQKISQQQSLAQQQQQQLLLKQHLQLISQNQLNQRINPNASNLLLNYGQNTQNLNNLPQNSFGLTSLNSHQQSYSTQVKQEEQDMGFDDEEMEDEEQVTAQQSPNKMASKNMESENKFDYHLDAEARARAATASSFNPIGDYKMVMMQTPIQNKRDSIYTPLNQQLATQQLIQQNSAALSNPSNPKLPEFQLNQVQPSIQLQNFLQMMKMNNNSQINNVQMNNNSNNGMNFSPMNINPNFLTKEQIIDLKRQMGITVRDRETLAPFLEQWNSIQETEQLIAGSYAILKSFPYEKTASYENVFKVEYTEQSQKCNYVNKFINSKGLIVKDEKLGKIKIENKISRFHNLSRLLMYTILTAFNKNNLALMNLDQLKQDSIAKTIQKLKQSARKKTPKGLIKTDFFNHTHYNVLFLTINEQNIEQVRKNSKDVGTHMKVFNVNLERPYHEIVEELRYSNIIKKLAYHIMLASYKKSKDDKKDLEQNNSSNSTFREQYIDRAMVGIGKLNQGVLIQRF